MRFCLIFFLSLLLSACGVAPRVSTQTERNTANATLTLVETALMVGHATGKIKPADYKLGMEQVMQLRDTVNKSETVPVGWDDVLEQVTFLASQWLLQPIDASANGGSSVPAPAPVDAEKK